MDHRYCRYRPHHRSRAVTPNQTVLYKLKTFTRFHEMTHDQQDELIDAVVDGLEAAQSARSQA